MEALVIGTRGSPLALAQARWVGARLRSAGACSFEIRVVKTTGDRLAKAPLARLGQEQGVKGLFTKELEEALLAGEVDVAVHSLKDLPTELHPRLALGCVPSRADPRDVLVGRRTTELAAGDVVGTGSARRAAQLLALVPGVQVADIRGNVDTRIRKQREGTYAAIVLAAAGLERLGLGAQASEYFEPERMVPAVGQGALGLETRRGDRRVLGLIGGLHDVAAAAEVAAERALLQALGGGCSVPLGGHARFRDGRLTLTAAAVDSEGGVIRAADADQAGAAAQLGERVATRLRQLGVDLTGAGA